jgi:methionine sulfoxide reductase heme-binding subunit
LISALDLSADIGLVAVVFATLNVAIGLLIWGRYSPWREWPHRRFDIFRLHRWTGYGTLTLTLLHPIPLLFASRPVFRIVDVAFPVWSPQQPLENAIGAAGLYMLVVVVVTSLYRIKLGRRIWKRFHYLTYAAAAAIFIHGILTDPQLNHSRIDPLDGEKVLVECCLALVAAATVWRLRHSRKRHAARERARSVIAALPETSDV